MQPISYTQDDIRYEANLIGADVNPGQTVTVSLEYIPTTSVLNYTLTGLPASTLAAATLRGPGGFEQGLPSSRKLTGLTPGAYTFTAEEVEAGGYVYAPTQPSRNLSLIAGQQHSLALEYVRQQGRVNLNLSGLPSGASTPSIRLRRGGLSYPLNPGLNNDLPTGSYSVEAPSVTVDGFTYLAELSPGSFSLAHNQTQNLSINYVRQSGTLNLTLVGLPSGAMRLEGPTTGNLEAGGSYVLLPGSYTLTASNVERDGFRYVPTVENGSFSLGVGATHNATVRYLAATARLQVSVTGVSGTTPITVSGPSSRTLEGSATLDFLEPGLYTITPSPVTRNESTPYGTGRYTYRASTASANLTPGQTVSTTLTYQRQQGNLVVNVSGLPSGSAASLRLEGNGIDHTFAGGSLTGLPTGSYTLTPAPVRIGGFTYRATAQEFTLAHNENQAIEVAYAPASGAVRIVLSGPGGMPAPSARLFQGGTLIGTYPSGTVVEDLLPGRYRVEPVTQRDEAGFDYTAPAQEVDVAAGQVAEASATYTKQSGFIQLSVSGAPTGYTLSLTGTRNYNLSSPGTYEVVSGSYNASAANLNHGGFVYRATVTPASLSVGPGQTVLINLTYTQVSGSFRFTLSGLPTASTQALVSLLGPTNYSANLRNGVTTTPDLLPSNYTLNTPDVAANGYTYRASGNAGSYNLTEGSTIPVSLSYAPITGRVQVNVSGHPSGSSPVLRIVQGGTTRHTFNGTASYELPPGSYTLQADNLSFGGFTYAPSGQGSFTVTAGQTVTMNVTYSATTGRLRVITSGLPWAPNYGVSGPQSLTVSQADQTFDNVAPGVYSASPPTQDWNPWGQVFYRYISGRNLVGVGELWGVTQTGIDSYILGQRDGYPGGWTPVPPNQLIGVYACINNQSQYPAQVGFLEAQFSGETLIEETRNWLGSGWQRQQWIMPGQNGCINTVLRTSNRSSLRIRPYIQIDDSPAWSGTGGTATFTQVRVAPVGMAGQATVTPGQTAVLYLHYASTASLRLNITRTSNNAPISVRFNGASYTAPGTYIINFLWPDYHGLAKDTTYNYGIAFIPSGPDPVLLGRSSELTDATVTYTPENRAALNLQIIKAYSGTDSRFINSTPNPLTLLQNGGGYQTVGVGSHSIMLWPANTYSLNQGVGYEYEFASSCGFFGCDKYYWRLDSITGLPLVPWAGEVYNAQAVWRAKQCFQGWFNTNCWYP